MENEKVIQIADTKDGIFGLSTSGQLIAFDRDAGSWVLRCSSEILTVDRANTLKRTDVVYHEPQGRHRNPDNVQTTPRRHSRFKMITPLHVAIALIALSILVWWFVN